MAEKWQKTSGPPPSCSMKPKPFSALNHFTVPWVISFSFRAEGVPGGGPPVRDRRTDRRNREERQAGTTATSENECRGTTAIAGHCTWPAGISGSGVHSIEVEPPAVLAPEPTALGLDAVHPVGAELHGALGVEHRAAGGGHDLQAGPAHVRIELQRPGPGARVPGRQQVGRVADDERAVPRAHELLGGGGGVRLVVQRAAAVGVGQAGPAGAALRAHPRSVLTCTALNIVEWLPAPACRAAI